MPEPQSLTDRVLAGRYRLERLIARGGMAEVWEATDGVLARAVAVKILHPHLAVDEAFVARFRLEAQAAARLSHPGIVATYDTGSDGDLAFIVMELVRGRTLRQSVEEAGTLPAGIAVGIAAEVAAALEHAHREGLVHRDVKPANILLAGDEDNTAPLLRVKVADFGIAKLQAGNATVANLTQTGAVVGTARYLSPEQVQGRTPDARSDVYGLGVVLYEMLCGRPPFTAETELATALLHVRQPLPALGNNGVEVPPALEAVVHKALAKDPDERYPSAAAFRNALLAVELEPDDAVPQVVRDPTPPSGLAVVRRPAQRQLVPLVVVMALVAGALAVAAVLGTRGGSGGGDGSGGGTGGGGDGETIAVASVSTFDPVGDGEENESRAGLATDGNPSTSWSTDRYNTRAFGGLKPGVGLVLQLGQPVDLAGLRITSRTSQWAATVYVADQPATDLAGWGSPVAQESGINGDASFDLGGQRGGAVLVWITDPGTGNKAEVAEVGLLRS